MILGVYGLIPASFFEAIQVVQKLFLKLRVFYAHFRVTREDL